MMVIATLAVAEEGLRAPGVERYLVRTAVDAPVGNGLQRYTGMKGVAPPRSVVSGERLSPGALVFVDSRCGSDGNSGLTELAPLASIARGVALARELSLQPQVRGLAVGQTRRIDSPENDG